MHVAAAHGHMGFLQMCVARGADLDVANCGMRAEPPIVTVPDFQLDFHAYARDVDFACVAVTLECCCALQRDYLRDISSTCWSSSTTYSTSLFVFIAFRYGTHCLQCLGRSHKRFRRSCKNNVKYLISRQTCSSCACEMFLLYYRMQRDSYGHRDCRQYRSDAPSLTPIHGV